MISFASPAQSLSPQSWISLLKYPLSLLELHSEENGFAGAVPMDNSSRLSCPFENTVAIQPEQQLY